MSCKMDEKQKKQSGKMGKMLRKCTDQGKTGPCFKKKSILCSVSVWHSLNKKIESKKHNKNRHYHRKTP
jgi:hypothetical protein